MQTALSAPAPPASREPASDEHRRNYPRFPPAKRACRRVTSRSARACCAATSRASKTATPFPRSRRCKRSLGARTAAEPVVRRRTGARDVRPVAERGRDPLPYPGAALLRTSERRRPPPAARDGAEVRRNVIERILDYSGSVETAVQWLKPDFADSLDVRDISRTYLRRIRQMLQLSTLRGTSRCHTQTASCRKLSTRT